MSNRDNVLSFGTLADWLRSLKAAGVRTITLGINSMLIIMEPDVPASNAGFILRSWCEEHGLRCGEVHGEYGDNLLVYASVPFDTRQVEQGTSPRPNPAMVGTYRLREIESDSDLEAMLERLAFKVFSYELEE